MLDPEEFFYFFKEHEFYKRIFSLFLMSNHEPIYTYFGIRPFLLFKDLIGYVECPSPIYFVVKNGINYFSMKISFSSRYFNKN